MRAICRSRWDVGTLASRSIGLTATNSQTQASNGAAQAGTDLEEAVRDYVRTYAVLHGRPKAAETLGVSRHTLWRFLQRGHTGRAISRAVMKRVGQSEQALEDAEERLILQAQARRRLKDGGGTVAARRTRPLPEALEDSLRLLCAAPLATVDELSRCGRVPASTMRDRLKRLAERGLANSVSHHLSVLGPHPKRRYFPTERGIIAGGRIEHGTEYFLTEYPVSKQWFWLLAERLDAVAVLYRVAAMIADADPHRKPVRVDHYRNGPYDLLITLSGGRSIGIIRQGATLPTSNLRYRLRSMESLPSRERPFVTLVMSHADQATRRAIRSLGDPSEHRRTFIATESELLAGDHTGVVWQQCGSGLGENPPVRIDGDTSLADILAWMDRLLDKSYSFVRDRPKANPEALYPSGVKTAMPEPTQQLAPALSVQLTRAEKDALDLLAARPLCTREQLVGLMGGVTLRRVNQMLRSLTQHGLVRADEPLHMLTDEGLTYLARRDRAAVGLTLDRWSAEPLYLNADIYAGSAVRALASQLRHHAGVTDFAAFLSAEVARSTDYDMWDLLPTSRSTIGYRYDWTTYVIHPDASFTLEYKGMWRPFLLEFERRATTPKRIPKRLNRRLRSRAPRRTHPRRVGSTYLLSGLVRCRTCNGALSGQDAKSGRYAYYVCQSIMKRGKDACGTPRLNARSFEEMVVSKLRDNVLTESNIRELVKLVDEEMDGIAKEQRQKLETIEAELVDVKRRLGRLYDLAETTDLDIDDFKPRIRDHRERQERLEASAQEARAMLSQRREVLDDVETITAYAQDLSVFLKESELTERRAFIESFVKEIVVQPGNALLRYSIPMPEDSPIGERDAEEVALHTPVLSTVKSGGPDLTKSRTDADSDIAPSLGMGTVYVSVASSPITSMPSTKLRMSAFRSGIVPSFRKSWNSATYRAISSVFGSSTLLCSSWVSASSLAASSCSSRCLRDMIRGDRTSRVNSLVSMAS